MAISNKLRIFGVVSGDETSKNVFNDWNASGMSLDVEHTGAVPGTVIYAREMNTALRNTSLITYALVDAIKDGTENNNNVTTTPTQDWTPTTPYDDTFKNNFSTSLRKFIYGQRVNYANNLTSDVIINIKDNSGTQRATGKFSAAGTTVNLQLSNTLDMNKSGSNGSITSYSFYGTTLGDKNNLFIDAYVTNYYGTNVGTNTSKIATGYITTVNSNKVLPDGNNKSIGDTDNYWSNAYITTTHGNLDGNASTATNTTNDADGDDIRSTYACSLNGTETDTIELLDKNGNILSRVTVDNVGCADSLTGSQSSINEYCHIWFSRTSQSNYKLYNDNFMYNPFAYKLKVGSTIIDTNSVSSGYFNATSDKRLKKNIKSWRPTKSILDLPLVEFDFKKDNSHHIGCIAQDLQKICPELVSKNEDGYLTIDESKIVYLLIDEVKKLKERVDELEGK